MKNDVNLEMLERLNTELFFELGPLAISPHNSPSSRTPLTKSLMGSVTAETPVEIEKLKDALCHLSPDVGRGNGRFFRVDGQPETDYWLAGVWAIASLGWTLGKSIAKNWSQKCAERYTEDGFESAWNSYNPNHPNPVGIGSLYKQAMQLGWQSQPVQPVGNRYKLQTGGDLSNLPPVSWRLKGVLPYEGLAAIYGPSASGKSFLALDLATAIAEGVDWFGLRTTQSSVVYVVLEGESGFKNRCAAWESENKRPLPSAMFMVMQEFSLTTPKDVYELSAAVPPGSVVLIDTLNRSAPTSDENSSKEMGEILQACKRLLGLIGGLVILVHHTGKDTTKGARGHSSLFAALDGAIEVTRLVDRRAWSIAKAKDGKDGDAFPFELVLHTLGVDSDGDDITSCTVRPAFGNILGKPQPKGAKQQAALKQVTLHIKSNGALNQAVTASTAASVCMKLDDAVTFLAGTLTMTAKNKRTNEARRLLTALTSGSFLGTGLDANQDTWVWVL